MKKYIKSLFAALLAATVLLGCEVENPTITDTVYLGTKNATATWLTGLRRQLALTLNQVIVNTELVSDNYFNNRTQSNKVFDIPQIDNFDLDVNNIQAAIQKLREYSEYGINTVAAEDKSTTPVQKAEMYFLNAYAHVLSAELFVALPGAGNGPALSPATHYALALTAMDQAIGLQTDATEKAVYTLLKARIYYDMGDIAQAKLAAATVMNSPLLLKQAMYDGQNAASNDFQTYLFTSSNNEFAVLPRLDFLDPKYYDTGSPTTQQKPVSYLKAEEAYLIFAEAQVAQSDLGGAKATLNSLLTEVIAKRPVVSINDSKETKNGGNRKDYPITAVKIRFDANDTERTGYVLNRQAGNINVATISGTMVTANDISAAATQDDLLYLVYRLRQEIFIGEGRRMTDLGIRFPVSQTEQLGNPNIKNTDVIAQIPAFIPLSRGMDDFTNNTATGVVTMKYDMNKVLVTNKMAKEIFPFIN